MTFLKTIDHHFVYAGDYTEEFSLISHLTTRHKTATNVFCYNEDLKIKQKMHVLFKLSDYCLVTTFKFIVILPGFVENR